MGMSTSEPLPTQSSRMVVVDGSATEAELTAIAVALDDHRANADEDKEAPAPSRWLRAARLEGCGHPPISDPTQL